MMKRFVANAYARIAVAVLILWSAASVNAVEFTWDGGASPDTLITNGANWVGDAVPPNSSEWLFPTGVVNTTVTLPLSSTNLGVNAITFGPSAPAYTLSQIGAGTSEDYSIPDITNNSSNMQTINAYIQVRGKTIKSGAGGITFGDNASNDARFLANNTSPVALWLAGNVNINIPQRGQSPRNVYGDNGVNTTYGTYGTLVLNANTGLGSTSSTGFIGAVNIWSGAVRAANDTALGFSSSTTNHTYIHGTFSSSLNSTSQALDGFENGFGRLEFANNVTILERVRWDSRIGDAEDFDHLVNVSGNNTLGSATANTGINAMGGAGRYNVASLAGKLTVGSATNMRVSDGSRSTVSVDNLTNSVFTFRGAGNIEIQGLVGQEAGFTNAILGLENTVSTVVRKQGSGVLTLSGTTNDWDGGTLIENGSVVATSAGGFSNVGSRVHVGNVGTGTLDLSTAGGLAMGAGKTLSGHGLVNGAVVTSAATAVLAPGGVGGLTNSSNLLANDLLTVSAGSGTLTLNTSLDMSSGGTYSWNLDALTESGAGTNFDQIVLNGGLTLGGASTIDLSTNSIAPDDLPGGANDNAFWHSNRSWTVLDQSNGSNTAQFSDLTLFGSANPGLISLNGSGDQGQFSLGLSGGDVVVNWTFAPVPEPGSFALAAIGLIGLAAVRRKR